MTTLFRSLEFINADLMTNPNSFLCQSNSLFIGNYYADAVGELILSRVGVFFLWRRKALRPYGTAPMLIRQQHLRRCHITN